jgi:lipopolysaccharide/colanic/teichoic acid biosynthesis glycosyltransferase
MSTQQADLLEPPSESHSTSLFFEPSLPLDARSTAWITLLEALPNCSSWRLFYVSALKRWFDLIIGSFAIVILLPLFAIVACAIFISMGTPVIFRQVRVGRNGQTFVMYKFRTMIADRRHHTAQFDGPERRMRHKTSHDPRVTRLGRFLRRTSIDELPQLLNVVRGDMSLIGPRPEIPHIVDGYATWQHRRHLVKPGITGWWQVQGRSDLPMHEHTELDIYYVEHLSLQLDLYIVLCTFRAVLSRAGAF